MTGAEPGGVVRPGHKTLGIGVNTLAGCGLSIHPGETEHVTTVGRPNPDANLVLRDACGLATAGTALRWGYVNDRALDGVDLSWTGSAFPAGTALFAGGGCTALRVEDARATNRSTGIYVRGGSGMWLSRIPNPTVEYPDLAWAGFAGPGEGELTSRCNLEPGERARHQGPRCSPVTPEARQASNARRTQRPKRPIARTLSNMLAIS
jgi:hypothetical protein